MERSEVSQHEVLVIKELCNQYGSWITAKELADKTGIAPRTARAHVNKLVKLGLVEMAEVFPGHRYQLSEFASKRNRGYFDRIKRAAEVLGIELSL